MYFKFPRPGSDDFLKALKGYHKLLVPPRDHPTEKNCYAIVDIEKLEVFFHQFGDLGEIILEDEMPDITRSQPTPFCIVTPKA